MEYDAIPHYLKMASAPKKSNINNNADSNKEKEKEKDTLPTLHGYPITPLHPINTCLHSVSSSNLAQKVSFKSLENILQSCKRPHTNSRKDKILGTSLDQNLNSLILRSNSNETCRGFQYKN